MKKTIAILATLDTKGKEAAFLKGIIESRGHRPLMIDIGLLETPLTEADLSNREIAQRAGKNLSELVRAGQRDRMIEVMGKGAASSLRGLFHEGKLDGVIALGGNQGSAIASMAMRGLPLGFPKFLVSTVASGNIRPYIGHKDIGILFSVGDFLGGPNPISRSVLTNAASAVIGMVEFGERIRLENRQPVIGISALGNTEKSVETATQLLLQRGMEVVPFHASGAGGTAMEELIEDRVIQAVLDLTPHELAEEVIGAGAYVPVLPGRLTAAGRAGIPQVVSTGALEYLCFGPRESIPPKLRKRKIYMHNPYNANLRVSRREMAQVGRIMAERLNEAKGPTAVLVPLKGWSVYGAEGGPLHDATGDRILVKSLKDHLEGHIRFHEIDAHINDRSFAGACVDMLMELMEEREK